MLLTNYVRFDRLSRTSNLLLLRVILSSDSCFLRIIKSSLFGCLDILN